MSASVLGQVVGSTVQSCDTELQLSGRFLRHVTDCRVTTEGVDGRHTTLQVETNRPHPADTRLPLVSFRGTYADAHLTSTYIWLVPLGMAVAVGTWWMGFPSRTDLTYGRHAALRTRRRR